MKLLLLLVAVLSVAVAAWLYFNLGYAWTWSVFLGGVTGVAFLGALDMAFDSVSVFLPLRDRVVADWREAWRWISVQMMALAGILQVVGFALEKAWLAVPASLTSSVSPATIQAISLVVLLLGLAGRLLKQPGTAEQ